MLNLSLFFGAVIFVAKKKGAYMSKSYFANVIDRIRDGMARFWIFHCCAVFFSRFITFRSIIVLLMPLRRGNWRSAFAGGLLPGCSFSLPASGVGGVCAKSMPLSIRQLEATPIGRCKKVRNGGCFAAHLLFFFCAGFGRMVRRAGLGVAERL